eukprot:5611859-Pyramimonas_sp.AAC.1
MARPRNVLNRRAPNTQESLPRSGMPHDLLGNRVVARDFPAIRAGLTLQGPARSTPPSGPSARPHPARPARL